MNRKLSRWVVAGAAALAMTLSACSGSAFNSTTETAGGSASAASEIMIGALHPLTGSVYEVAVPHSLGDRDHSPFDAATHHDLLAAALTSAGPAPFGPDLVVDVVAALPTAASAATELARLRLAEPERKP